MPNIGSTPNSKTEELLRDEQAYPDADTGETNEVPQVIKDAIPTVVEKEVPATSSTVMVDPEMREFEGDILEPKDPKAEEVKNQIVKAAMESGEKEIAKRTRKPAPKTIPSNLVEIYKEKIALVEHVQHVEIALAVGIDTEVISSKGGRDIIITLQKEIEEAKNKALLAIQSL